MSSPFLIGTPVDFEQVILADVEEILVSESHSYAVVQFLDILGLYTGSTNEIAIYNREGGSPSQGSPTRGFSAGISDQVVFHKEELEKGVKIINAQNGLNMGINIQYYRH
tara:strand:+ start:922 stop:1251 length:330 start_codon:yes stop_codon:yes gene_type:complete